MPAAPRRDRALGLPHARRRADRRGRTGRAGRPPAPRRRASGRWRRGRSPGSASGKTTARASTMPSAARSSAAPKQDPSGSAQPRCVWASKSRTSAKRGPAGRRTTARAARRRSAPAGRRTGAGCRPRRTWLARRHAAAGSRSVVSTGRSSETVTRQPSSAFATSRAPRCVLERRSSTVTVCSIRTNPKRPSGRRPTTPSAWTESAVHRQLLTLGERGDRDRQARAGRGDERVLGAPQIGVGAVELRRRRDPQRRPCRRRARSSAGRRPTRSGRGSGTPCGGSGLPCAHAACPSASPSTCSSKNRPIDVAG